MFSGEKKSTSSASQQTDDAPTKGSFILWPRIPKRCARENRRLCRTRQAEYARHRRACAGNPRRPSGKGKDRKLVRCATATEQSLLRRRIEMGAPEHRKTP